MPLFSKDQRSVFYIHIPKTGGTSIETAFEQHNWSLRYFHAPGRGHGKDLTPCNPQHWHRDLLVQNCSVNERDNSFTVVRNPFTRLISEMLWRDRRAVNHAKQHGFDAAFMQILDSFFVSHWVKHEQHAKKYIESDAATRNKLRFHGDNHFRPQHEFILDNSQVFLYEELVEQDWLPLKQQYQLTTLGHEQQRYNPSVPRPTAFIGSPSDDFCKYYLTAYQRDHEQWSYPLPF